MKILTRTLAIKLTEGHEALQQTLTAFCAALNHASQYAQANGIWTNGGLQRPLYGSIRGNYGLKAQMTCSVFRQVAAAYKHDEPTKQARKRSRMIVFKPRAMLLQYERDWSFLAAGRLSINTLAGRLKTTWKVGHHQRQYLDGRWTYGAATLVRRRDGRFFLHVSVSKERAEPSVADNIVGVDLGQNYLAVASNLENKAIFIGGGSVKDRNRHYQRVRKSLQTKGTRGAKRTLRRLAGKQRRFQADINHCTSKRVVKFAGESGNSLIALEDLKSIRARAKRRGKRARREFHGWAFQQLRFFLGYKAEERGLPVVAVDPRNTSRSCSRCGHVAEGQRQRHVFACKACGFSLHADLNASRNIAQRARLVRQDCARLGTPSWCPEATSIDAEAPRGELRPRAVASP